MTPRKLTAEQKIRRALRGLDLEGLEGEERKDSVINLRVTEAEKEEIQATAEALELSVAEYLLNLHRHVRGQVKG